jgi:hypothetical protein
MVWQLMAFSFVNNNRTFSFLSGLCAVFCKNEMNFSNCAQSSNFQILKLYKWQHQEA